MIKSDDKLLQEIAEAARKWVVPGTTRVERMAEIICEDPDQVISRPLPNGVDIPDEGDTIYFSSQDADIPAFVCESDFDSYCSERGLNEIPSDGRFFSVSYLVYGQTFAGEEIFLGGYGSPAQVEEIVNAIIEPVQSMMDSGLLAAPQLPDAAPEL